MSGIPYLDPDLDEDFTVSVPPLSADPLTRGGLPDLDTSLNCLRVTLVDYLDFCAMFLLVSPFCSPF